MVILRETSQLPQIIPKLRVISSRAMTEADSFFLWPQVTLQSFATPIWSPAQDLNILSFLCIYFIWFNLHSAIYHRRTTNSTWSLGLKRKFSCCLKAKFCGGSCRSGTLFLSRIVLGRQTLLVKATQRRGILDWIRLSIVSGIAWVTSLSPRVRFAEVFEVVRRPLSHSNHGAPNAESEFGYHCHQRNSWVSQWGNKFHGSAHWR